MAAQKLIKLKPLIKISSHYVCSQIPAKAIVTGTLKILKLSTKYLSQGSRASSCMPKWIKTFKIQVICLILSLKSSQVSPKPILLNSDYLIVTLEKSMVTS